MMRSCLAAAGWISLGVLGLTAISPQVSAQDLTVTSTHTGAFLLGQTNAYYLIRVKNIGSAPTSGYVSVTENAPAGLTITAMRGDGWTCTASSCGRSDTLGAGASYPAIVVLAGVEPNAGSGLLNQVRVAGGGDTNAANNSTSDGTLVYAHGYPVAWGNNTYGQATALKGLTNVVAVSAGGGFSLALKSDGTVEAWGDNSSGQTSVPNGLAGVIAISAANSHALALKGDGTVVSWGAASGTVPAGLSSVVAISAGNVNNLALRGDGTVAAWGLDRLVGTKVPADLTGVVACSAGNTGNIALKGDGSVVEWGRPSDADVARLSNVVAVASGVYSLALKSDGSVVAWGGPGNGENAVPAGLTKVVAIASGDGHSLALKNDGTVVTWGANVEGQSNLPPGLADVFAISDGSGTSLAVMSSPPSWIQATVAVAPNSSLVEVSVDRTAYSGGIPLTFNWIPGSSHTLEAVPPHSPIAGRHYSFARWSDGGAALHAVSPTTPTTYIASFQVRECVDAGACEALDGAAGSSADTSVKLGSAAKASVPLPQRSLKPLSAPALPAGGYILSTAAGGGSGAMGNGVPATAQVVASPIAVATDASGNIYVAQRDINVVRRVDVASSLITTIAGTQTAGFSGDGGPASSAQLRSPTGVAVDGAGNVLITDAWNNRLRRIDAATGIITTIAGTGDSGFSGDGGLATSAMLRGPTNPVIDASGNIYFVDGSSRIRKIAAGTNIISTVAGNGEYAFTGDGGPATSAAFEYAMGLVVDAAGNLYISDSRNQRVRKVTAATGIIDTIAGGGTLPQGSTGDGGPATSAVLGQPFGLAMDGAGNLFIADASSNRVRLVTAATGIISTIAGSGAWGAGGDGGRATDGQFQEVEAVAVDASGNVYVADWGNQSIRKLTPLSGTGGTIVSSIPLGAGVTVDGTTISTPYAFDWAPGTSHKLVAANLAPGATGAQFRFQSWSQGGAASQSVTVAAAPTTYLAKYGAQYYLTTAVSPHGAIAPASGWYDSGASVSVTATPDPGFALVGFNGALSGWVNPQTLTMDRPQSVSAVFAAAQPITINSYPAGLTITVDGHSTTTPSTFQWAPGAVHSLQASVQNYAYGTEYLFQNWSQGGDSSQSITVPAGAATYTANFLTRYYLSISASVGGSVTPSSSDFYDAGTVVSFAAKPNTGYTFGGFSGALSGTASPQNLAMTQPQSVSADFVQSPLDGGYIISTVAGSGRYSSSGDGSLAILASMSPNAVAISGAGDLYVADGPSWSGHIRKVASDTGIITTIAGGGSALGDGGPAANAQLKTPFALTFDPNGNLYIADQADCRIRKIALASGNITTVAGTGVCGFSGDGGNAASAQLNQPAGIALDASGNLFISDSGNNRIRKVDRTTAIISTIAGDGTAGFKGDGGPASSSELASPIGIAFDTARNLYIADSGNAAIRKISASTGLITTVVGRGAPGETGDGGAATAATLVSPNGVAFDAAGNLYISDGSQARIRKVVQSSGTITTIAGGGNGGYGQDGVPATSVSLSSPAGLTVATSGAVYFADRSNDRICKLSIRSGSGDVLITSAPLGLRINVDGAEVTTPYALNWAPGSSHTLMAPNAAQLVPGIQAAFQQWSQGGAAAQTIVAPATSTVYSAAYQYQCYLSTSSGVGGKISPASGWSPCGYSAYVNASPSPGYTFARFTGDLTGPTASQSIALSGPKSVFAEFSPVADNSRFVITTVAGSGSNTTGADGALAISTNISPKAVAVDGSGNVLIADANGGRIRRVSASTGVITTLAGNGTSGFSGDGGPAASAQLGYPYSVVVDPNGNVYIADSSNFRIREVVAATGKIITIAGDGTQGYGGDGGLAVNAHLSGGSALAVDSSGNLYIADYGNNRVRKVNAISHVITTIAGTGWSGFAGDGGAATAAQLDSPNAVAVDLAGNVYISDGGNARVRKITVATGRMSTVAGNGNYGYNGDNILATAAAVPPAGLALDGAGNLFITDPNIERVRRVDSTTGIVTTVAGNGSDGFRGDGGLATDASFNTPTGIAIDPGGNLYVVDSSNNRVRKLSKVSRGGSQLISSQPLGLAVKVDGTTVTTPFFANWAAGSTHTLQAPDSAPVASGTQYAFQAWLAGTSSLGSGAAQTITAASGSATYVAQFKTQYYLTISAGAGGTVSPVSGWNDAWSSVSISGVPASGYAFNGFSGALTGMPARQSLMMSTPLSVAANFAPVSASGGYVIGTIPQIGLYYSGYPQTAIVGLATNSSGDLFVSNQNGSVVQKLSAATARVTVLAGGGDTSYGNGDGGLATNARIGYPSGIAFGAGGDFFVSDSGSQTVRKVTASTGIITTVAGGGTPPSGSIGDGALATGATLNNPDGLAVDAGGNLFIVDTGNQRIRKVASGTGIITTVAGTGDAGFSGDGGDAANAMLNTPTAIALDAGGNLYIADQKNHRIRRVAVDTGIITTFAGTGTAGYANDGGPASGAQLNAPIALAFDRAGDLFIADQGNNAIRVVAAGSRIISTIAGNSNALAVYGDGGFAMLTAVPSPRGIAVDASGIVYIAQDNGSLRKLVMPAGSGNFLVSSLPFGLPITVDGAAVKTPYAFDWTPGSSHTLLAPLTLAGSAGIQYVYPRWSQGGATSQTITVPATSMSYVASYSTEFYLTTSAGPGGQIKPGSGWYGSGQIAPLAAGPDPGFAFTGFSGDLTSTAANFSVPMVGPLSVKANFAPGQPITIASQPPGLQVSVDGAALTTPATVYWAAGSSHFLSAQNLIQVPAQTQYVFANWSQGGDLNQNIVAPATATTYTANYQPQFYLTTAAGVGGTISPVSGWYNSGAKLSVSVSSIAGYSFQGFLGDLSGTAMPQTLTMNAPKSVTAAFTSPQTVTITSQPAGLALKVDGAPITTPANLQWVPGTPHTLAADATLAGAAGTQYTFQSWGQGGTASQTLTAPLVPATYSASYQTRYYLTTSAGNGGSISPTSGWYAAGTVASVSAAASLGYEFSGFSGSLSGAGTPQVLTMNAPRAVSAEFTASANAGGYIISTIAGGGPPLGTNATSVRLSWLNGMSRDASGNLYVIDGTGRLLFISAAGKLTRVLNLSGCPNSVALDAASNIYLADACSSTIKRVDAVSGSITVAAGSGINGSAGEGGPALNLQLSRPTAITLDPKGNLYIADYWNNRIIKVDAVSSIATRVAGTNQLYGTFSGDGGPATSAGLNSPTGLLVDSVGNLYIADSGNSRIRKVTAASGTITTVAGTDRRSGWSDTFAGDGGPATASSLDDPSGLALDGKGNLYIADTYNNRIRMVKAANGIISTVAGSGLGDNNGAGFSGDGGLATAAQLGQPQQIVLDSDGNLYIGDSGNGRIRVVRAATGIITTSVGGAGSNAEGISATDAQLAPSSGVADSHGNLYIAEGYRIWKFDAGTGALTTYAGGVNSGYSGDGGPAASAKFNYILGLATDREDNLYLADGYNCLVRKISSATGVVTTVAGNGTCWATGDGGPALSAGLNEPYAVAVDRAGNIFINDVYDGLVRKVTAATGIISTYAGGGSYGQIVDGVQATKTTLVNPGEIAVDGDGNLFITDNTNNLVREVSAATGIIQTVAGISSGSRSGDGSFARSTYLGALSTVAVDSSGNLLIAQSTQNIVRQVNLATGIIATVAGNGSRGFGGDGGPARGAQLNAPEGAFPDANGNFYVVDSGNMRVRKATVSAPVQTPIAIVTVPPGLSVSVDGVTVSTPHAFFWASGSTHAIRASDTLAGTALGTQYVFQSWSQGGEASQTITAPAAGATYTATYQMQYALTTAAGSGGTISPASGWFNPGATVSLKATANTGYVFSGFAGDLTGATTPQTLIMSAPRYVSASFANPNLPVPKFEYPPDGAIQRPPGAKR